MGGKDVHRVPQGTSSDQTPNRWLEPYLALQAVLGAIWWVAVLVNPHVRTAFLGKTLDPQWLLPTDALLFVGGSVLTLGAFVKALPWRFAALHALFGVVAYATLLSTSVWLVRSEGPWGMASMGLCLLGLTWASRNRHRPEPNAR